MPISDEQLERLGEFYCSEFVTKNMPWIRELTFEEFVQRELRERDNRLKMTA